MWHAVHNATRRSQHCRYLHWRPRSRPASRPKGLTWSVLSAYEGSCASDSPESAANAELQKVLKVGSVLSARQ